MAILPISALSEKTFDNPLHSLTEAHMEAKKCAQSLNGSLALASEIDWPDVWKKTTQLAEAMQKIAEAERACGGWSGRDHRSSGPYTQMLQHHRDAYLDLKRVTRKLTHNHSHSREAVSILVGNLEHHLDEAEKSHLASLGEKTFSISQAPHFI